MKTSIISTVVAVALIGFAGLLSMADNQAAEWPQSPEFTVSLIDDPAVIDAALALPEGAAFAGDYYAIGFYEGSETCRSIQMLSRCGTILDRVSIGLAVPAGTVASENWRWPKRVR